MYHCIPLHTHTHTHTQGYDLVLIETVGVGQSETLITEIAGLFCFVTRSLVTIIGPFGHLRGARTLRTRQVSFASILGLF